MLCGHDRAPKKVYHLAVGGSDPRIGRLCHSCYEEREGPRLTSIDSILEQKARAGDIYYVENSCQRYGSQRRRVQFTDEDRTILAFTHDG